MAITDVVVPQLSESVSEATLLTWKKKPGEAVTADEILIEVETDKVVLEVPAPASGVFAEIVRADGSMVASGEVIARIDTAGKAAVASTEPAPQPLLRQSQPHLWQPPWRALVSRHRPPLKFWPKKALQHQTLRAQVATDVLPKVTPSVLRRLALRQPRPLR
jgi:2-oxoglutarate dehydrogenase E2 component (dihydrolipoamide succinyltransferase)